MPLLRHAACPPRLSSPEKSASPVSSIIGFPHGPGYLALDPSWSCNLNHPAHKGGCPQIRFRGQAHDALPILTIVGVPALGGFVAWIVAKRFGRQDMLKQVRAASSGSMDLDQVREDLARCSDKLGMSFELAHLDRLAGIVMAEPVVLRKKALAGVRARLRQVAFGKFP